MWDGATLDIWNIQQGTWPVGGGGSHGHGATPRRARPGGQKAKGGGHRGDPCVHDQSSPQSTLKYCIEQRLS